MAGDRDSAWEFDRVSRIPGKAWSLSLLALCWLTAILADHARMSSSRLSYQPLQHSEVMILAADFCPPLPEWLKSSLRRGALLLEDEPGAAMVVAGKPVPEKVLSRLPEGLREIARYREAPTPELQKELFNKGSRAAQRLNLCFLGLGGLIILTLTTLLLSERKPPESVGGAVDGLWVLGLFWCWSAANWFLLGPILRSGLVSSLVASLLAPSVGSALIALAILSYASKKFSWRPGLTGSAGWIGLGYVLALTAIPLVNRVMLSFLEGPILPYSRGIVTILARGSLEGKLSLLFLALVLAPLLEELIFRGWLLQGLRGPLGQTRAIWVSAFFFASVHGDIGHFPGLLVAGAVFGWAYARSGSILVSAAVHAMWNATSLLYAWAGIL